MHSPNQSLRSISRLPSAIFLDVRQINSSMLRIYAFLLTVNSFNFLESNAIFTDFAGDDCWADEAIFVNVIRFLNVA